MLATPSFTRGVAISGFFREAQRFQLRHILQIDSLGCMIFGHRSRGVYFPQASEFDFGFGQIGLLRLGHLLYYRPITFVP